MSRVETSEGPALDLVARIGRGAMGEVWRARYDDDGTEVAVKILSNLHDRPEARTNFLQEIRAQAKLQHPGVVQVLGYGDFTESFALENGMEVPAGTPYLSMELARYGTLREIHGPNTWNELESLLRQILDALAYAHARRMVHRDLKPDNILLCVEEDPETGAERRRYKLTDFGIAHAMNLSSRRESHEVFQPEAGTPYYMPPEQIRGEWRKFGSWTDLYAIGCIAYELAAGSPPFTGDDVVEIATSHLSDPVPPLEPLFPVPERFEQWLHALLGKEIDDRFGWAADAAWGLEQLEAPEQADEPLEDTHLESEPSEDLLPATREEVGEQTTIPMTERFARTKTLRYGATADRLDTGLQWEGASPTSFDLPPLPESWGRGDTAIRQPLSRVSEKLFKLREVPFVGRREERDLLWEALAEVVETGTTRVVSIQGPPGVGKTRLADWLGNRVRELSQATVLDASFRPEGHEKSELAYIGRSWYRTWGLDREEARRQIRTKLSALIGENMGDEQLDRLAERSVELIFNTPSDDELERRGTQDRVIDGVASIFSGLSFRRPVYIAFDNVQWSRYALELVRHFVANPEEAPLLIALTHYDADTSKRERFSAETLGEIHRAEQTRRLELEPLDDASIAHMLRSQIDLTDPTVDVLVDLANGFPRTALEHLERWVACDNLVTTPDGYRVMRRSDVRERDES